MRSYTIIGSLLAAFVASIFVAQAAQRQQNTDILLPIVIPGESTERSDESDTGRPTPRPTRTPNTDANTPSPTPTPTATATMAQTQPMATPTATTVPEQATATPTNVPDTPVTENWEDAWLVNSNGTTSTEITGAQINIQSVTQQTISNVSYQCIVTSGIPDYEVTVDQALVEELNNRPNASSDFGPRGETTLSVGDTAAFGSDVGYRPSMGCTQGNDGYGYWPPGPGCATDQNKEQCFPLDPQPDATNECETGLGAIGTWINGVSIYNWSDGASYNDERVWENNASAFEINDLDICLGHSANGDYHHHSHPRCLAEQLDDDGSAASPIYGFAADGYPIYGPWHDAGVLAVSCWIPRDYDNPASATGCGVAGERSCLLVDQYDISLGTTPASSNGPTTSETVTSMSNNPFVTASGFYFQDYYYDPSCTQQGEQYLDEHNGHDHDGLGYHYHVTLEESGQGEYAPTFPYYIGPSFAGELQGNAIASCSASNSGPGEGGPGDGPPEDGPPGGGPPGGGPPGP